MIYYWVIYFGLCCFRMISTIQRYTKKYKKKVLFFLWWLFFGLFVVSLPSFASVTPSETWFGSTKLVEDANMWIAWTDKFQKGGLENIVKLIANWVLWILWLIALLVLLRWGFQMVTAAWNEDQYNSWYTYLKNAAIWIAIIWVAWFIVSMIFFVLNLATENAVDTWWSSL